MKKITRYWCYLIYLSCVALFIIPYSTTFDSGPEESMGTWVNNSASNTPELGSIVIFVMLLVMFIPKIGSRVTKIVAILILLLLSLLSCFAALLLWNVMAPDYIPLGGMFVPIALFPLVVIYCLLEWRASPTSLP